MSALAEVAAALWGENWRAEMHLQTGVNERSIRRMDISGKPIPAGLKAELAVLLRAEAQRLETMAEALEQDARDGATNSPRAGCGLCKGGSLACVRVGCPLE